MAGCISLDDFNRCKVDDLRIFIRARGQPVGCKRKNELVAIAYAISQQNLPVVLSKVELQSQVDVDYENLLCVDGVRLCDPWQLVDGWKDERVGVPLWPPCMYINIADWLIEHDERALLTRLGNDYKEGKAFSYFASQQAWVKEVFYHPVNEQSPICFLKTECTPSQNVRQIPHRLWVALNKDSGAIKTAYCTCFAGLGSTCNHVAALLFKIDYAWQQGLTMKKPCTSIANQWLAPTMVNVAPTRTKDMIINKPKYAKKKKTSAAQTVARQLFCPLAVSSEQQPPVLEDLVEALYPECPESVAFQYALPNCCAVYEPYCDANVSVYEDCLTSVELSITSDPVPFYLYAKQFTVATDLLLNMPSYTVEQLSSIEEITKGQAQCSSWFENRRGRISASIAYRVHTKCQSLKSNCSASVTNLLNTIVARDQCQPLKTPGVVYGTENEPLAADVYELVNGACHSDLTVSICGLFVHPTAPYLCASPDRVVTCCCCGTGLLEIKCPLTCENIRPQDANLSYLCFDVDSNKHSLKRNHAYYAQIQMQMGVTGKLWCDFFVYSKVGHYLERIPFDEEYWQALKMSCTYFFENYVAQELVNKQ